MDCVSAGHQNADLWVFVRSNVDECLDEGISISVVWNKAHITLEEKARKSPQNRQLSWANEKADELAENGAIKNGAEVAERIATYAFYIRQKAFAAIRYAATFQYDVEELVDGEEISEEDKNRPK